MRRALVSAGSSVSTLQRLGARTLSKALGRAYVAKDPNYMGTWPENAETYTFQIEGETLHLTWPSDWAPGKRSGTFRKVEGQPAPW